MIHAEPLVGSADMAAAVAAASASAITSVGAAADSEQAKTDAVAARDAARDYAGGVVSLLRLYWLPGHEPDIVSLDPVTYGEVWSAQTQVARVDAIAAAGSFTFRQYWLPGVTASTAPMITDSTGALLFEPPNGGSLENASNLIIDQNFTNKVGVPREIETRPILVVAMGQSLDAEEGAYTPALIDTVPINAAKVMMSEKGIKPYGQSWSALIPAVDQYTNSSHYSVGSDPTDAIQSMTVSLLNQLYTLINTNNGLEPFIIGLNAAITGQPIEDLAPGGVALDRFIADLERMRDAVAALGTTFSDVVVTFGHGNASVARVMAPKYTTWLIWIQKYVTEACQRILGIKGEVKFFIEACTSARSTVGDVYDIVQVALDLPRTMRDKFGWLPSSVDILHKDGTHEYPAGYSFRNRRRGEVIYYEKWGGGFTPFAVVDAVARGATTIEATILVDWPPIVRDLSTNSQAVTISIASPGVVSGWTSDTLIEGTTAYLETTGVLPTGLATQRPFYVKNQGATFNLALTSGGAAIVTSGSQSGTHTLIVAGDGIQVDDDSGAPPYVKSVTIADDGTSSGPPPGANDPPGYAKLTIETSGALATYGNWRLLVSHLKGPDATHDGPPAGASTTIRDSATGMSPNDLTGAANPTHLYNRLARSVTPIRRN